MKSIYRYEVPVDDGVCVIALSDPPAHVGCRHFATVEFWALHDPDAKVRNYRFRVVGTGHPLPDDMVKYWGTAVAPGGNLVWHLIEVHS